MAPRLPTYFDYYQGPVESEPLAIGGFVPLQHVYEYEPVPAALTPEQAPRVLGAQAQLWGEYIKDAAHQEYMAYPRACAMAVVLWSAEKDPFDAFLLRLDAHLERAARGGGELPPARRRGKTYLTLDDAYRLDDVRKALRDGDVGRAARLSRVYKLTPVSG